MIGSLSSCCRDGLERVEVSDNGTVGDLKKAIQERLNVPADDQVLSKQRELVRPVPLCNCNDFPQPLTHFVPPSTLSPAAAEQRRQSH